MVDNFGPPYKRLTSLTDYFAAANSTPIERQMIRGTWYKNKPTLSDEQIAYVVQVMDSNGNLHTPVNTSGEFVVTGTSLDAISTNTLNTQRELQHTSPFAYTANGTALLGLLRPWVAMLPQTVVADGAGNPPATALIPLLAASEIDVAIWMVSDSDAGANQFQFDFRTDPLAAVGGIAVVDPDWTAVVLPLEDHVDTPQSTWGHRMETTVAASAFGIANGANGDWPNDAQVTFYGFYRYI